MNQVRPGEQAGTKQPFTGAGGEKLNAPAGIERDRSDDPRRDQSGGGGQGFIVQQGRGGNRTGLAGRKPSHHFASVPLRYLYAQLDSSLDQACRSCVKTGEERTFPLLGRFRPHEKGVFKSRMEDDHLEKNYCGTRIPTCLDF